MSEKSWVFVRVYRDPYYIRNYGRLHVSDSCCEHSALGCANDLNRWNVNGAEGGGNPMYLAMPVEAAQTALCTDWTREFINKW
jgi:hypothetical protein